MDVQTNQEVTWTSLELGELLEEEYAHVHFERTIKHMALHPYHLNNVQRGINQILMSSLNSYDKELKGFLLAFKNPGLLAISEIFYDTPFIHIDVEADFYLFRPTVGSFLKGIVNKKGLDHIVVLVHKTYTISIPKPDDTEEWFGDMVEIGQEVKCYINQIDTKSKPPFICGVLNTNYSQGCRLFDSTLNNTTDVADTAEDQDLNMESHEDSHIKREKGSLLDFNVTERKRKKKFDSTLNNTTDVVDTAEDHNLNMESHEDSHIKREKDSLLDFNVTERKRKKKFDSTFNNTTDAVDTTEDHDLNMESHKDNHIKREKGSLLDFNVTETERKRKKKFDSTLNNITDVDTTEDYNLHIESHEDSHIKREKGSLLNFNVTETERKRKKKHTKKSKIHTMSESETEDFDVKIKIEKPDSIENGIVNGKLENEVFDNQDKLVQNEDLELPKIFNLKIESHRSLKRESSISLDNISETEKKKKKKHMKKCDPDPEFCKDSKDGILDADLSASIADFAIPKKHKKSKKRLKSESEVEDYFPVKIKVEKPDPLLDV